MANKKALIWAAGLATLAICGLCAIAIALGESDSEPTAEPAQVSATITATEAATETSPATATKTPQPSPTFTLTPDPDTATATATPTETPLPTSTPAPIPIILEGFGDSVVTIDKWNGPAIILVQGNQSGRFFGVTSLGANNETLDLLVNTVDPYQGTRPLDFGGEQTKRLKVEGEGGWKIEVMPLSMGRIFVIPGDAKGNGDEVLLLSGGIPDTAIIQGNNAGRFFGVTGYVNQGWPDLLVNTVDPYEGTVLLADSTIVLVIEATGEWSIEVMAK